MNLLKLITPLSLQSQKDFSTFGIGGLGTGGTGALDVTQIGSNLTFPAGCDWIVHKLWGNVSKKTTIPDQGTGGQLLIDSLSGDVVPDPAPGKYPMLGNSISSSADAGLGVNPLNIWDVLWQASGKAAIKLSYMNQLPSTTGSITSGGVIFGSVVPEVRAKMFCDGVYNAFASASETQIGSITLSEKATRITGILANLNHGEAATAGESNHGIVRIQSNDIILAPGVYPCDRAFDATDGTAVGAPSMPRSEFIPLDIEVPGGAIINIFGTTSEAVTANAEMQVFIAYE